MKRSNRRNLLRYFLTVGLFAFLGTLFVFLQKENIENGTHISLQPATEKDGGNGIDKDIDGYRREKGPENTLMNTFPENKNTVRDLAGDENLPLNVYIFEEHHEALPYWFGAAFNRTIPKTGNTLIHIDGHSDMAPPEYFPGYPMFKWPAEDQLRLLMQRNDAFIQSSIMAGLITRVIWIWPEWDRKNHEKDFLMSTVKLGWTLANNTGSSRLEKTFCMCQQTEVKTECMHLKERDENGIEEAIIDPVKCHVKKTIPVIEINEAMAVLFLKQKEWIKEAESVILDIDEDFYGCSYVIKPLLDTNVSVNSLRLLDENVRRIVCPRATLHETNANKFIFDTLSLLIIQKSCKLNFQSTPTCSELVLNQDANRYLTDLLTNAHIKNETNLCIQQGKPIRFQNFVKRFIQILSKFSIEQLKLVRKIGFCSTTTPKTLDLYGLPEFGLCYGANTPLESAVTEFNPTSDDIQKRSEIFEKIIQNTKIYSPTFVTLCRSMRDGYTPRKYFTLIENQIVNTLKETFGNVNLHYDEDLMNGKSGRGYDMFV